MIPLINHYSQWGRTVRSWSNLPSYGIIHWGLTITRVILTTSSYYVGWSQDYSHLPYCNYRNLGHCKLYKLTSSDPYGYPEIRQGNHHVPLGEYSQISDISIYDHMYMYIYINIYINIYIYIVIYQTKPGSSSNLCATWCRVQRMNALDLTKGIAIYNMFI